MPQPIPVTLVTGFLGAGKTTIISNLIKEIENTRFAVVVNEFGEVTIDDSIIEQNSRHEPLEVYRLTHELLAYNRQDEFLNTMLSIWERNRLIDHVIVETSGLAAPTAALEVLQTQDLRDKYILDSTIAVIDVPRFISEGNYEKDPGVLEVLGHQLRCADVVALNKIDSLTEDSLLEVETKIRKHYSGIRFLEFARQGRLEPAVALGLKLNQPAVTLTVRHNPTGTGKASGIYNGHSHSDLGAHEHGISTHEHIHEHDPGWVSFVLRSKDYQDCRRLVSAIEKITLSEPLFRCKGMVHESGSKAHVLIQGVRNRVTYQLCESTDARGTENSPSVGNEYPHEPLREHEPGEHKDHRHSTQHRDQHTRQQAHPHDYLAELVFIGYHLNREKTTAALNQLSGSHWE